MATFESADLQDARFIATDLRGARFVRSDLSGAVLRGVQLGRADLDAPWLIESGEPLWVNGVDVTGYVNAELDRRFPGRSLRRPADSDQLRAAWAALESAWTGVFARVSAMSPEIPDVSVDGEWSFAQTVRHLVMAIDTWLRGAVLEIAEPYHPIGQPNVEYYSDGYDPTVFSPGLPAYDEVLAAFAERATMVRDYVSTVTAQTLGEEHPHPWAPHYSETVLGCLITILEEGWEHLRYATRDLDALTRR
ncbi:DinB family protein [Calidifontibacter terrae]